MNSTDEVIMFEPVFEYYYRQAQIFGGRCKFLEMTPPPSGSNNWSYDFDKIERSINENTKLLMINTPHNPTGKVLTDYEIQRFVDIAKKWPKLIIVSDEVILKPL